LTTVTLEDIRAAADRIKGSATVTPLLPATQISGGPALYLKAENLQQTGSFKIRGALNAAARLSAQARDRGLITYSSGNHGQALASTARQHRVPCVIVMPDSARKVKIEGARALGAEVVLVPPAQRKQVAEELATSRDMTLIPPYDHPDVIAGQGTVGLEILEQIPQVEVVLVPVGGGALASGVATAIKAVAPGVSVVGVEPELAADAAAGLRAGRLAQWPPDRLNRTVADGLRTNLSDLTFTHLQQFLDGIITVDDERILQAVDLLIGRSHLVVEPSGAATVAAYLAHQEQFAGKTTVAILSGGNLDRAMLGQIFSQ